MKKVRDHGERPTRRLVTGIVETDRFDFDKELLPEDSWESGEASGRYEVEAIVDDDLPLSSSISRDQRRFLVKWKCYDTPTWGAVTLSIVRRFIIQLPTVEEAIELVEDGAGGR